MRMNPGDRKLNAYLYNTVWTGSDYRNDFPPPYGAMEDDASVLGGIVVGGLGEVSTEYGSGVSPSGFADQIGNSPYHDPADYETALGTFVNGACGATCLNVAMNGVGTGYGNVSACSIISNRHCHDQYYSGMIDDQAAIDNICATVRGNNLKYLAAERPVFAGRFGFEFLNSQTVTMGINTNANLYSHTSDGCATTKIVDVEVSYGMGGRGDVTGGYRVRLAALAWRWLVANPATGIPDRVVSFQYTEGGTLTEVPYFFEDTLVPDGAEVSVPSSCGTAGCRPWAAAAPQRTATAAERSHCSCNASALRESTASSTSTSTSTERTTARRRPASIPARRPSASSVPGSSTTRSRRTNTRLLYKAAR